MSESESNQPNEWNVNPSNVTYSPEYYENVLKPWKEPAGASLSSFTKQGGGGRMQDRATRLFNESVACTSLMIRD